MYTELFPIRTRIVLHFRCLCNVHPASVCHCIAYLLWRSAGSWLWFQRSNYIPVPISLEGGIHLPTTLLMIDCLFSRPVWKACGQTVVSSTACLQICTGNQWDLHFPLQKHSGHSFYSGRKKKKELIQNSRITFNQTLTLSSRLPTTKNTEYLELRVLLSVVFSLLFSKSEESFIE